MTDLMNIRNETNDLGARDTGAGRTDALSADLHQRLRQRVTLAEVPHLPRRKLAQTIGDLLAEGLEAHRLSLDMLAQRNLVTQLLNGLLAEAEGTHSVRHGAGEPESAAAASGPARGSDAGPRSRLRGRLEEVKAAIQPALLDRIDISVASRLEPEELGRQIADLVAELIVEKKQQLNGPEHQQLVALLVHDMVGFGPIEPLLADPSVTDIMVNGPKQVYVERGGKLELTDITFRDNAHVMNVATRIVTRIGRRIDESSPLADARLPDGSRVNIIAPPLAIDGPSISIRKFAKKSITLDIMARQKNISEPLARVLKIAARCRLNIIISGGTGSGKTTLLNALSRLIDPGERIVTIEDAAELQLQQPHVVRLETRPPSLEGTGEITMRDLVKNALRMRPDRIILGEVRGAEAFDMMQAMNTGHDGSMCTLHANSPREALTRLENLVAMTGVKMPSRAVRTQIAEAVDLIVQISRMRDGVRRVTRVTEIVGMEEDVITTQDLFAYEFLGEDEQGNLQGQFRSSGLRPHFMPQAEYYRLADDLMQAMGS